MASSTETVTSNAQTIRVRTEDVGPAKPAAFASEALTDIDSIPVFTNKYEERKWAKGQMAGAFRVFAKLGFADGAAGHVSLRDPIDPSLFWINPYARHFSMIRVSDLILVNADGEVQEPTQYKINRAGFVIHSTLHEMRPDVNAVCHFHSPYGRAWSAFGKPIEMLVQDSCYFFDDLSVYEGFGGVVLAKEEGIHIAEALGPKNKSIILQNHGLLTCGGTLAEAAARFIILERGCQTQLLIEAAAASGVAKKYIGDAKAGYTNREDCRPEGLYTAFQPEYEAVLEETNGAFWK